MKNLIITFLFVLTLFSTITSLRVAAWAELVSGPYMEYLDLARKCDTAIVLLNRLPIVEKATGLPTYSDPLRARDICQKSENQLLQYQISRSDYRNYRWHKVFKTLSKRIK